MLVLDDDRQCVEATLGACRLLGVARSEVEGKALEDVLGRGMRDRIIHFWRAFADSGGEAGPFDVDGADGPQQVRLVLRANVVPGKHVVMIEPTEAYSQPDVARGEVAPRGARPPSTRECEVLSLLAHGNTDAQIAARLRLSPATVQTHVRNAKAKLGARTRAQAVAVALGDGLI